MHKNVFENQSIVGVGVLFEIQKALPAIVLLVATRSVLKRVHFQNHF